MPLLRPDFEPSHYLYIDFETAYDPKHGYGLKQMTTFDYIWDEKFETIGVGVAVDDGEPVWMEGEDFREWAKSVRWDEVAVVHHHAAFDAFILSQRYDIHPAVILCTQEMACGWHGTLEPRSLAKLAERYGAGVKGDEVVRAMGKWRRHFTDEEWLQYGSYCKTDVVLTRDIFQKMVGAGFPEDELWLVDATVRMFTEPKFVLDEAKMREYVAWEKARKAALVERVVQPCSDAAETRKALMSNDKFALLLTELGVEPPRKISSITGKETWAFAKSDAGMKALLEHENQEVQWAAEARVATKSTINETRGERYLRMGANGRAMPVALNFCRAHTFRWSGGMKCNWQNHERVDPTGQDKRKGTIRQSVMAPPGHVVVAGDSSQIEARVLAWLAGHHELVAAFAQKRDIYSELATIIYRQPVDRKRKLEDGSYPDAVRGHVAKAAQLGLGYGLGAAKFAEVMLRGAVGGPQVVFNEADAEAMCVDVSRFARSEKKMAKMETVLTQISGHAKVVHFAVAEDVVYTWRDNNEPIKALWGLFGDVLSGMLSETDEYEFGGPTGKLMRTTRHGIVMPNGLTLHYPGLRQGGEEGDDGEGFSYLSGYGKKRARAYGGSMTENIVQSLARIVIGQQMLHLKAAYGYDAQLCTHDEIVLVVPEAEGDLALRRVREALTTAPDWAEGLPLGCDTGKGARYGGAK